MATTINAGTGTGGAAISADTTGVLALQSGSTPTTAVTIDTAQNVGIGTASPNAKLDILATTNTIRFGRSTSSYSSIDSNSGAGSLNINADAGNIAGGGSMAFNMSGTERMRIDSNGNLLVGTTSLISGQGCKITASQPNNAIAAELTVTNASFSDNVLRVRATRGQAGGTFNAISYYNDGNADYKFIVYDNGNVVNTNNSYGAYSDIKLKENIVDASPKLEDLCKVKVRQYNLKSDPNHKQLGVVAQELEEVFAGLIEETADKDVDGNDLGTTTKQVKYSVFVPMLIKAIQEQQAIIESQAADIAALKVKVGI